MAIRWQLFSRSSTYIYMKLKDYQQAVATFRHEEAVAPRSSNPRRLNFFETQINVMRNCVKKNMAERGGDREDALYKCTDLLTYLHQ